MPLEGHFDGGLQKKLFVWIALKVISVTITPSALTADELLPILVYLVIISDIPNWNGNMAYINNFHFSRIGAEEFAYVCMHLRTVMN